MASSLTVVVAGQRHEQLLGILTANSTEPHDFNQDDINFLKVVSNILASAVNRKSNEDALRESESRFRQMAENIYEMFWIADRNFSKFLSKAVKYSPAGSPIKVVLEDRPGKLMVKIIDQGLGIPAADIPLLFNSFHRARNVAYIPDTGLGLTIAKRFIDHNRGTIEVESQPGQGSTFTVTLPAFTA